MKIIKTENSALTSNIILAVEAVTNIKFGTMDRITRKREIVEARYWVMYFHRRKTNMSLRAIGALFSKIYDHSTVLHAINEIEGFMGNSRHFRATKLKIESELEMFENIYYSPQVGAIDPFSHSQLILAVKQ